MEFARAEFAKYLQGTAIRLELEVDAALGEDAYRLRELNGALEVTGGNPRGCLYGVYSFLEQEGGARFYTSWRERPPRRDTVVPKGLDRTAKPAFEVRCAYWYDAMRFPFGAKLGLNANPFGTVPESCGGNACRFGKGMASCHTLGSLLPDPGNICLTDERNYEVVLGRVLDRIAADPGARFYGISYDDNGAWCRCARCEKVNAEEGAPAGTLVRFVNRIADVVAAKYPGVMLETLAYQHTVKCPKTPLRKNVTVCLCSNECEFMNPIAKSPLKANADFRKAVEEWGAKGPLYVWDYTTDFGSYLMPWANGPVLAENVRFFRDHGVRYLFEQGDYQGRHADFGEWKAYLLAKLMWNPDLDVESLKRDFFSGYYGAGAKDVLAYLAFLERTAAEYGARTGFTTGFAREDPLPYMDEAFVRAARVFWDTAERATADDPAANYCVRMGSLTIDYVELRLLMDAKPRDERRLGAVAAKMNAKLREAGDVRLLEFPQSLAGRINAVLTSGGCADLQLPEAYAKGDVNLKPVSVTDGAAWIWGEGNANTQRFKCRFHSDGKPLTMHVSADNRYTLYVDGRRIGRGPDRGTVDRWTFRSYCVELLPGDHVVEAVVTFLGDAAPLAQLTAGTPGFLLRAEGSYDAALTTGKGPWRAKPFANMTPIKAEVNAFGVGAPVRIDGDSAWANFWDDNVRTTHVMRAAVGAGGGWGVEVGKWHLYPSSLPPQKDELKSPGRVVAVVADAASNHVYAAADTRHPAIAAFNRLFADGAEVTVPSNTHWTVLWDLGNYYCAYPELDLMCGPGGHVKWAWAESLAHPRPAGAFGALDKGNRGEFVGKAFTGYEDVYIPAGGAAGEGFQTPWWRCGRWCRLDIRSADRPLTIKRLQIAETGYPIRPVAAFACDDASLDPVQGICVRGLQMNSHEMGFDCPYYEQQMYGGDSRIQFLTHHALHADDRLVRRNIELFDESRRPDGRIGMNFPTRGTQESTSFTFMWPMMLADYAAWRTNRTWLAQRMPGLLHTMEGLRNFERTDGLLADLPGWNFIDWTTWPSEKAYYGEPKDVDRMSGILNLFYLYALRSAAYVCEAMGEPDYAATYRRRFARTAAAYVRTFWCEKEGLCSDTDTMDSFSQHSQALAIVLSVLPPGRDELVRKALVERTDLVPATVSFKHYVFEAFTKMGRGDLILKELDLWRSYVAKGLKTGQEMPDPTRSDCHGWSSHPLYALQAEIAGVTPAAPFFASLRVAPSPGALKFIRSTTPTPKGEVALDLRFSGGKASGTVTLPGGLSGTFEFGGRKVALKSGENEI